MGGGPPPRGIENCWEGENVARMGGGECRRKGESPNHWTLTLLHAHLIVTGLQKDPLASTKLIESYSQMGYVESAIMIFDAFQSPDSVMWGVIIKCHVWNGLFRDAICMYQNMLCTLKEINRFIFPPVLRACSAINCLEEGKKVHAMVIKSGFHSDPFVGSSLVGMYGEVGSLCNAKRVFDEMSNRDMVSWSSLISSYVQRGKGSEGLEIFREMVKQGVEIDHVSLLSIAEACGELDLWRVGRLVHSYVVRRNINHEALCSCLVAMYGKFGDLCSAERLFFNGVFESVLSWTTMISCYNQNGYYREAVGLLIEMQECGVEANGVTLMTVVCSCARLEWLNQGKAVHAYILRNHVDLDRDYLRLALIDLYANCGKLNYSHLIFDTSEDSNVVMWNILISGYVREQMAEEALSLFVQMLIQGIQPDSFTLSSAVSACGIIGLSEFGCQIHCFVIKKYLPTEFVNNALIDMYAKCGFMKSAYRIFHDNQKESVVAWNCMMCGFSQNGYSEEAIRLFDEMYSKYLDIDEITFLSVTQACANAGLIDRGKWIHHKLITFGVKKDMYIDTALTNMYARCGNLHMARKVFDNMRERSIVSWSTMIGGYAIHGHIDDSISLFNEMIRLGIKPNDITFMNIMSACSHAGYVKEGKFYFNSMIRDFGIVPNSEHYACLVDLLSRAGDLNGAYEVINSMSFPADASVWGALVNGCRIHQRMDFLASIRIDLVNMHADDSGYFTLLSNVYAGGGKWNEFRTVRSKMRQIGKPKNAIEGVQQEKNEKYDLEVDLRDEISKLEGEAESVVASVRVVLDTLGYCAVICGLSVKILDGRYWLVHMKIQPSSSIQCANGT
ncbi:pentatricopeptide repeat-containing protein mitochondrial-like [Dorcoceras hygrometricum]|uniref:Pentatricopeptide repeat-containing protein mitochondrial-like n=1 Tax=Dorcoceras hygrometricum TaxID=472368 RepID=A0A2Z7CUF7_9LAMI|nr:pentatricopeptide repeat-containing protein mitochondrial-like [Dorcoceras hygrometricum]